MIDTATLGIALGAGSVAALNPCGFAFLPGYLGLVIVGSRDASRPVALARAAAATAVMTLGFLTVFGVFGLAVAPVLASAQKYLPFATVLIGVGLIGVGGWLLAGREISVVVPRRADAAPTARLGSMYGYGVGYALASLSCTAAPFLAVISVTFRRGSVLNGVLAFLAYAGGMAVTVGVAALAVALAGASAGSALRRVLPHVNRIAGLVVLLTGVFVTYYGYYELRVFFADAGPDPVIRAAGLVQSWLADSVEAIGVWWLLGALGAVVAVGLGVQAVSRRR